MNTVLKEKLELSSREVGSLIPEDLEATEMRVIKPKVTKDVFVTEVKKYT